MGRQSYSGNLLLRVEVHCHPSCFNATSQEQLGHISVNQQILSDLTPNDQYGCNIDSTVNELYVLSNGQLPCNFSEASTLHVYFTIKQQQL